MKLQPRDIDAFLKAPGEAVAALIYGPDEGLVRERAGILGKSILGDADDPFAKTELSVKEMTDDPARLVDEMLSPTLLGGRRLVVLPNAADSAAAAIEMALEADHPPNFLIALGGELRPNSRLRKLFEGAKNAAAIACYADNARDLEQLVRGTVASAGFKIEPDAVDFLLSQLGSDRMVSRGELEKLLLYKGDPATPITLEDAMDAVGDSGAMAIDQVIDATTKGDLTSLDRALTRLEAAGESPIGVLRLLSRRLQRLHLYQSARDAGAPPDKALAALTPRAFWMEAAALKQTERFWTTGRLARAMGIVLEAEEKSKSTGFPPEVICAQACFRIAGAARQKRR